MCLFTHSPQVQLVRGIFFIVTCSSRGGVILLDHECPVHDGGQHPDTDHSHTDGVTHMIRRSIPGQKAKRRHDPARVAETDEIRRADASFHVAFQIHDVPAQDDGADGEGAHRDEANG